MIRNHKRAAQLLGQKFTVSQRSSRQSQLGFGPSRRTAPETPKKTKEEELLEQLEAMKKQLEDEKLAREEAQERAKEAERGWREAER